MNHDHHLAEQMHRDPIGAAVNTSAPAPPFDQALIALTTLTGEHLRRLEDQAIALGVIAGAGVEDSLRRTANTIARHALEALAQVRHARRDAGEHIDFLQDRIAELDTERQAYVDAATVDYNALERAYERLSDRLLPDSPSDAVMALLAALRDIKANLENALGAEPPAGGNGRRAMAEDALAIVANALDSWHRRPEQPDPTLRLPNADDTVPVVTDLSPLTALEPLRRGQRADVCELAGRYYLRQAGLPRPGDLIPMHRIDARLVAGDDVPPPAGIPPELAGQ